MSTLKEKSIGKRSSDNSSRLKTLSTSSSHSVVQKNSGVENTGMAGAITDIQTTLHNINNRLDRLETVNKNLEEIKNDIYARDGLDHRLKTLADEAHGIDSDVHTVKEENVRLRLELDLLKSVVMRMDKKITDMDKEIISLKSRSMRDNVLVHNFPYAPNEDLMTAVPIAIKEQLGIDVEFVRIHRNGMRRGSDSRPVSITEKLQNRSAKDAILKAQKAKKALGTRLPFHITAQEPIPVVEDRKRLYDISESFRKDNQQTRVVKDKLILPSGEEYEDVVPMMKNSDVLKFDADTLSQLNTVETFSTPEVEREGNVMFATGAKTYSASDVETVYRKVCCDPKSASAHHRILVYRFRDERDGKIRQNYHDDGEYGAGRRLLKYMTDNEITNSTIVITKHDSGRYIGYQRFQILEDLVCDIENELDS
ncbi:hypothetical protein FSP39_019522 [Pinctada imbricata]|uniref:Impact N-terminal domain-containing protein n=1 Tax=Pinctada imbricata TaxID=66713 RepID=A0AA89BKV0_PINIB|nr:hypothetical protein FSP39_019522 [Pinctada imbricata]